MVNLNPGGNVRLFAFATTACVDLGVAVNKPKPPGTAGPCAITATGTIRGYCDFATGTAALTYTSSNFTTYTFQVKLTWASGTFVMRAGTAGTNLHFLAMVLPNPLCAVKAAFAFTLVGTFELKDLNLAAVTEP